MNVKCWASLGCWYERSKMNNKDLKFWKRILIVTLVIFGAVLIGFGINARSREQRRIENKAIAQRQTTPAPTVTSTPTIAPTPTVQPTPAVSNEDDWVEDFNRRYGRN